MHIMIYHVILYPLVLLRKVTNLVTFLGTKLTYFPLAIPLTSLSKNAIF